MYKRQALTHDARDEIRGRGQAAAIDCPLRQVAVHRQRQHALCGFAHRRGPQQRSGCLLYTSWTLAALLAVTPLVATPVFAQAGVGENYRWLTFAVFAAIIAVTMYVTYLAAKRVRSASDFYTAGGGVSGCLLYTSRCV